MMSNIKKILKKNSLIASTLATKRMYQKENCKSTGKMNEIKYIFSNLSNVKVYTNKNKLDQIQKVFQTANLQINRDDIFFYSIDFNTKPVFINVAINNITIDYSILLESSLNDLKSNTYYCDVFNIFIDYCNRIINTVEVSDNKNKAIIKKHFENMITSECKSFREALQRILFVNQILWQTGHELIGIGRFDTFLYKYYQEDINNNVITKEQALSLVKEFMLMLHKDYYLKSGELPGDTGQIIIVGGKNADGTYVNNDLTTIAIEAIMELQIPDPKVLLRVHSNTDRKLMELAVQCIATGLGCPLLSNDDVIIPKLVSFGCSEEEAYNYMTSACWEPLIAGHSFDQNNQERINFLVPFEKFLADSSEKKYNNIEDIWENYFKELDIYLEEKINYLSQLKFEEDPCLSVFIKDCLKSGNDISVGGAKHNNFGFTTIALANVVESIINIQEYVFKQKKYSFDLLEKARKQNFINKDILSDLKDNKMKFGMDKPYVIEVANRIIEHTSSFLSKYENQFGGKYKFGCSSPNYITSSNETAASFDGRLEGEPYRVHISGKGDVAYTELISFASKLNYTGVAFNGNVVDFIVSPHILSENFEKFVDFIILSVRCGFFQMQLNVVSSKILISARNDPSSYKGLIVRVWGFSAYYNDLPDSYKDLLISRALECEGKV